jgi:hypothetical protein
MHQLKISVIMQIIKNKKGIGNLNTGMIESMIIGLVLLVVLFVTGSELIPEAQTAGDTLCSSGIPFAGLFSGDGLVFIIVAASLLLVVVFAFLKKGKK